MIKKDKTVYLNYVKDIESKINDLFRYISAGSSTIMIKEIYGKLMAHLDLIKIHANRENDMIPNAQWERMQDEVNSLYKQLYQAVQQAIVMSQMKDNR